MARSRRGPAWTDADKWKAKRALEAWDGQYTVAQKIEFPEWTLGIDPWSQRVRRLAPWEPPEGTERLPLLIEDEPERALELCNAVAGQPPRSLWHLAFTPTEIPTTVVPDPLAADNPELLRLERKVQALEQEKRDLRKKLTAERKASTLADAVVATLEENVRSLEPVSPAIILKDTHRVTPVDAVALLSDQHADEEITAPSSWGMEVYGFDVYRARLWRWAELTAAYLRDHLPRHEFKRLWIAHLGDSINGDIHDAGPRNSFGNSLLAALAVGDVQAQALQWIYRETGVPITLVGVSGNHPRRTTRKDYADPWNNLDFLVGTQMATRLKDEPGVEIHLPRSYTAFMDVRSHLWALGHGDDVRGYNGIPWYGFVRRADRVQALVSRKNVRVSYYAWGHYHQEATVPTAGAKSFHNGAFPFSGPFAQESLAVGSEPSQRLFVVEDTRGVIGDFSLYLRDEARESALDDGSWEPPVASHTVLDQVNPVAHTGLSGLHIHRAA